MKDALTLFQPDLVLDYTIRESRRAKTVRLNMTPQDGLVVVIPAGYNRKRIAAIIEEKRDWITRARLWADEQQRLLAARPLLAVPATIDFRAVGQSWRVEPRPTASKRVTAREHAGGRLVLSGPTGDIGAGLDALGRWTGRRARLHLTPWLEDLGRSHGFAFGKTIIGNQSSCWGSCSPKMTISLNRKLLFLPEHLVRYVLIHELCHTVHLNHSKRFWARVGRLEPDWKELRRQLCESWQLVPGWIER